MKYNYCEGPFVVFGHVFIEVFLDNRWYLIDPVYKKFYGDYDPNLIHYPCLKEHGACQIFCCRGKDFWDMGSKTPNDLISRMLKMSREYSGDY
jgi:hypothetical protein